MASGHDYDWLVALLHEEATSRPQRPSHFGFRDSLKRACFAGVLLTLSLLANAAPFSSAAASQLHRLVGDLCHREVVFLGEDNNHGAGGTVEVKRYLIEKLIDQCNFSAVFFESGIYDFVDLEARVDQRTVTREQIADAIGGLWSITSQGEALATSLHARVQSKGLHLMGLDLQAGSATSRYQKSRFAKELTAKLPPQQRSNCETRISRHLVWSYDDKIPYDGRAQAALSACASDIRQSFSGTKPNTIWPTIAHNFAQYLRLSTLSAIDQKRLRSDTMYENFRWHRARLPPNTKAIVWTAGVHAIKRRSSANAASIVRPLGMQVHEALGEKSAAVGFCALQGVYALINRAETRAINTKSDSLEAQSFKGYEASIRYLNSKQLHTLGAVEGNALSYSAGSTERWSALFDAIIVLREEQAVKVIHRAVPQQPE
jgi:erythromycin esterase-like protein